jgi:membrane fusion protein (multidrug efflux system)
LVRYLSARPRDFLLVATPGAGKTAFALRIAGVGAGHEVITTPLSWVATSNVILEVGARPVFVEIDPVTRNIRLQGTLKNPEGLLRPGMFGRILLSLGEADEVTAIPVTAVIAATYGDSVFVLEEKTDQTGAKQLVANQRFIRTGRSEGDFVAVTEGLKPGDTVVSAGAFKLRNGSPVEVNNEMAPHPERQPSPEDS